MLQNPSSDVRECYEHAQWCSSQAEMAMNQQMREELLRLAEKWSKLARSYEVARTKGCPADSGARKNAAQATAVESAPRNGGPTQ
jgi:hypothetical protein